MFHSVVLRSFVFVLCLCVAFPAHAVLKLDITRGSVEPLPIAITDFALTSENNASLGRQISEVIRNNLTRSGLFKSIDPRAFIVQEPGTDQIPTFSNWRPINAQALVTGSIQETGANGGLVIAFRLWDVLSERQFAGKSFTTTPQNWRRVAHLISDEIYKRLTGEEGYFDSRIVYVAETGSKKKPVKRLAIMDQDGASIKYLTQGKALALTPRFSPNSQKLIYMSYSRSKPQVFIYDLETGKEDLLGNFQGMSFAPRFSHDGRYAIMSVALSGNSEIFEINLNTKEKKRLTQDPAIDTSPSYSPDGKQIVFNSDRGGSQQLYVMNRNGSGVKRISFGEGRYGTPVWSPRGDLIAFTKMKGGLFHIGVMRSDGSGERLLTESFLDEGPTWSPNGRVIIFTRQTENRSSRPSKSELYSIDLTGYNERLVSTETNASDPAWSPLLK